MEASDSLTYTHYNEFTGLPCNCYYGRPKHMRRTASQAVRQIRNQNQKHFRSEEGQQFLNALEEYAGRHAMEPLVPWIANRYKKGDFQLRPPEGEDGPGRIMRWGRDIDRDLPGWMQWMQARQHPSRRGVNIMELDPEEVERRARELRQEIQERQTKQNWLRDYGPGGEHRHTFDPSHANDEDEEELLKQHRGWQVHQLISPEHAEAESAALGHCIGQDSQNYKRAIDQGRIQAYSLRDKDGYPKVTWHFNEDESLAHIQGKSGYPQQKWRDLISMFNEGEGLDDDDGGEGDEHGIDIGDPEIHLPDPGSVEEYMDQFHPNAELYELAEGHGTLGEDTEVIPGTPDWEDIFEDLTTNLDPARRQEFYQTVLYNSHTHGPPDPRRGPYVRGHADGLQQEVNSYKRLPDENRDFYDRQIEQEWEQAFERSHNAQGVFTQPQYDWNGRDYEWQTPWSQVNQPMFTEPPGMEEGLDPYERNRRWQQGWGQYTEPFGYETTEWRPYTAPGEPYGEVPVVRPRQANILDPIHPTLDPRVWDLPGSDRPMLKRHHKDWITREIFEVAAKMAPNPEQWLRLVLTGSLTTYQYSDTSDCDVSLFVNPNFMPEWNRGKLIGLMVSEMDGTKLPGTPFEMQDFVVAKSISPADLYQPGLRSGYDIESDTWLNPPERNRVHNVEQEFNSDYVYALESADKMERLLRYDPDRAVDFWHQIHRRRRRDEAAGKGDYSQSNIVYKFLANRGLFPEIAQASGEYIAKVATPWVVDEWDPEDSEWRAPPSPPAEDEEFHYHVAPSHWRDTILREGLNPEHSTWGITYPEAQEEGEYIGGPDKAAENAYRLWLHPSLESAQRYMGYGEGQSDWQSADVWRVNAHGLPLQYEGDDWGAHTTHHRVTPDRLSLINPDGTPRVVGPIREGRTAADPDPVWDPELLKKLEEYDRSTPEERRRRSIDRKLTTGWTPGQWGKGLYIPGNNPEVISWNTGTRSLNGGTPHHAEVGRHIGMNDGDFHERLGNRDLWLVQLNPQGVAYECCFGERLPDEYYEKSGFTRPAPPKRRENLWS